MRLSILSIVLLAGCRREEQRVAADPSPSSSASLSSTGVGAKPRLSCPANMVLVHGDDSKQPNLCMDRTETTVDQYARCVADKACDAPRLHTQSAWECTSGGPKTGDHPVTCSSYADAVKYCRWSGKRVPTATEWTWVAHGGALRTKYPWGDTPFGPGVCISGSSSKETGTCQVGAHPQDITPDGVQDLFGNAAEWVVGDLSRADAGLTECGTECCSAGAEGTDTAMTAPRNFSTFRQMRFMPCHERSAGQVGFRCVMSPVLMDAGAT